jgi:kynurenine formamidase
MPELTLPQPLTVLDLSHTLSAGMPVYPGTEPPVISTPCTIEEHGFTEKLISLYSHTGTHVDAPAHILKGAPALDQLPIAQFAGPGTVLDFSRLGRPVIELEDVQAFQAQIEGKAFVLLRSGWADWWGQAAYFEGFPVLSQAAAEWLARFPLKGIGLDSISIDPCSSAALPNHRIILKRGLVIVENLTGLEALVGRAFLFCCWPLKIEGGDGSPVRAAAVIVEKTR